MLLYFYHVFNFCLGPITLWLRPDSRPKVAPTTAQIPAQGKAQIEAQVWLACKLNCNFTPQAHFTAILSLLSRAQAHHFHLQGPMASAVSSLHVAWLGSMHTSQSVPHMAQ